MADTSRRAASGDATAALQSGHEEHLEKEHLRNLGRSPHDDGHVDGEGGVGEGGVGEGGVGLGPGAGGDGFPAPSNAVTASASIDVSPN